ncbi:Fe2+-dependent dioxygenase [Tabrizicola flagellatus]|uniref:Fe2+-dependent dioxygenase n=1 Tax=Tabrizicola flagellatus TaxID=2593021 RepID=UPI0011F191BE|nr:Fe2+-dependent dioxygenase [Tabrizicola flagellatus]
MMLVIQGLIPPAEAAVLREAARELDFADGKATAGRFAREVKANDQAAPSPEREAIFARVERALRENGLFRSAARPRAISPLILSRYREGQTYGLHVDDAVMGGLRTDLSFTLFLCDPASYVGGALVIEDTLETRAIRPGAGDLILYPSTTLHRVEPVTRGERLAVVGWVQSQIRRADQREILFDLDQAVEAAHAREGKSGQFDRLAKTRANLIRMWAET